MRTEPGFFSRLLLIAIGCLATLLAIIGAILPGLPATPFLLVALWAFARSSNTLYSWLQRIPLLKHALIEARRFEERRTIRLVIKLMAVAMAWGSVAFTALVTQGQQPMLLAAVTLAAIMGTVFMWVMPTDRG